MSAPPAYDAPHAPPAYTCARATEAQTAVPAPTPAAVPSPSDDDAASVNTSEASSAYTPSLASGTTYDAASLASIATRYSGKDATPPPTYQMAVCAHEPRSLAPAARALKIGICVANPALGVALALCPSKRERVCRTCGDSVVVPVKKFFT